MRLHVHEWGDANAPPVVCLHGITGHGERFRRIAEERLAARYRVLAFDLRGHGRSRWEPPWDVETHAADVLETATALGAERPAWIGHSFGGRVLMHLAARAPERVERMILLDPAIQTSPADGLEGAESERAEKAFASFEDALATRLSGPGLVNTPREFVEEDLRAHLVRSDDGRHRYRYCQSTVVSLYGAMAGPPPPYERLRVPTLLLVADEGELVLPEQERAYRDALGDLLEVVHVPGGHIVLWESYAQTSAAIERFLARAGA